MSESVVVPVVLLREAIQELVLGLDVMGDCDHSEGYCVCPLRRTIESLEAISAAPTPEPEMCEWREDEEGQWFAKCGAAWTFFEASGPDENGMSFCYCCGNTLLPIAYQQYVPPEEAATDPAPEPNTNFPEISSKLVGDRMSAERLAVLERNCEIIASKKYRGWVFEIVAALKAERQRAEAAEAKLEKADAVNQMLRTLITAYELDHIPGLQLSLKEADDKPEAVLGLPKRRDTDWVLAIGHAVGLDSGLNVPIIPDPKVVREFLDSYVEAKLVKVSARLHDLLTLDIPELQLSLKEANDRLEAVKGLPEKWKGYEYHTEHPEYAAGLYDCANELEALLK